MTPNDAGHGVLGVPVPEPSVRFIAGTQRVADFLLKLCPAEDGPAEVALPYDKSLIASRLGMKPESFSRSLARMRDLGVRSERSHVSISDAAALADYCEGGTLPSDRRPS